MKKTYIIPILQVAYVTEGLPIAQSNRVDDNSVNLNPNTMSDGDGGDAVKGNSGYNVWDDDWSN